MACGAGLTMSLRYESYIMHTTCSSLVPRPCLALHCESLAGNEAILLAECKAIVGQA